MKDVLITGGAGKIGYDLVNKLLNSNYSITVLDLESRESIYKLKKIKDQIKIVYGDVEDKNLIMDLVKKNDIVIDYAGIMPPLANLNEDIANSTNYMGCKNIVDAINEVNPKCIYLYMSFISIYGTTDNVVKLRTVDGETDHPEDYYSVSLIRSEEYIRTHLKRYTILRMPIVLTRNNYYVKHMALNRMIDFITVSDFNDIVISLMTAKRVYGKTFNISGFKANSTVFLRKMYKATGRLSLLSRNLYYGEYDDAENIQNYIDIKYQNINTYFKEVSKRTNPLKKILRKIINSIKYLIINKK